jgi:MFS family permease
LGAPLWVFSAATTLSITGTVVQKITVGWSVWEATHTTTWLATAALADLLPTLIMSVPAGALVDRFQPATTFWLSQTAACLQALVLCALAASGHLTIAGLLACAIFLGVCNAFTVPARLAYMTQLTPRESFPRAVVLYSLGGNAAFFAGPMIASVLISAFGTGAAYAANAIAYVPMIAVALTLPTLEQKPTESHVRESVLRQMRDGLVYARHNGTIFLMLLSFAAIACTARGIMELAPSIAATVLNGGLETLSWLMSSFAVGALAAGICIARWSGWRERVTIITTLAGSAVALIGYGACGYIVLALVSAVLLGFMVAANNISVNSAIQMHSAPQYRGRINSLYNMIFKGGPAVGAAVFGWLAHLTDVRLSSAVAAIVLALLMLWIVSQATARSARKAARVNSPITGWRSHEGQP